VYIVHKFTSFSYKFVNNVDYHFVGRRNDQNNNKDLRESYNPYKQNYDVYTNKPNET
jgi:hypothetical protein